MPEDLNKKWERYWQDPDKIREKNRAYYYTSRGLPVPEKKTKYQLRDPAQRGTKVYDELMASVKERIKELDEREKALEERERRIKKIEESYTLKSYQPTYRQPRAQEKVAACAVGSASAPVSFTVGKDDFK